MSDTASMAAALYGAPAPAPAAQPAPTNVQPAQAPARETAERPEADDSGHWDTAPTEMTQEGEEDDAPQAAEQPAPMSAEQQLQAINDAVPADIRDLRQDPARLLFSAQVEHASTLTDADVTKAHPDLSADVRAAILHEAREIFTDTGFTAAEAKDMLAAAVRFDASQPADKLWAQTAKALNDGLGMQAKAGYEAAIALANRDPRVAQSLARSGQGNNPAVVVAFAKAALRERAAGRL